MALRPQISLQDHIKLWNVEGIEGSNAVKLNLKQPEQSSYFETALELKTARRKVIQKLIKENIEAIKRNKKTIDTNRDYTFKFQEKRDHIVIKNRDANTQFLQSPYMHVDDRLDLRSKT